ncbi:glycosyl transferase family 2 [Treponema brennaborense DSM 12168]|uniref:Glycosyl transferase family 2 n=2 Tax=Treponema TaxID=157 RepID=F4LIE3_TREBD|nr:glycosyl transferase family 2 [Treponema brennaborense DSM 12168]
MISVCMATYNGVRFIKEQLNSILAQLSADDELIISDDGSTDGTLEIIGSYKDDRIKLFHHKQNPSFSEIKYCRNFYYTTSNFENALIHANGDYIFLSDQDDIWLPQKKDRMVSALRTADLVMSNFNIIDDDGNILKKAFYQTNPISNFTLLNIIKSKFIGCCMAFNKEVLRASLPFPEKLLAHDYWIGLVSSQDYSFLFISEPLLNYRRFDSNVSSSTGKSKNNFLFRIRFRLVILIQLTFRIFRRRRFQK